MIVLTPHTRLRALASTTAGRTIITQLLAQVVPLLHDQAEARVILARASRDDGWQCQFASSSDALNMLASQLHRAMPGMPEPVRYGSAEWHSEQSRRHMEIRGILNGYIDAAEALAVAL